MDKSKLKEVCWGIIGVGNVCEVKSAPAMKLVPNSKLVAVMRRDEAKVKDYAARHQVSKWYTDANSLINDPEVNAIYIATPPNAHGTLARLVAKTGKPVYVEKPMARSYQECLEMITACRETETSLYVAYYRRALPHFVKIKELIQGGVIGAIRTVHIDIKQELDSHIIANTEENWRVNPEIAGGGYFYDLASHQMDLMDFLLGPIIDASGFSTNQADMYEAEDLVSGVFKFESGVIGSGNWCFTTAECSKIDQTIIYGSKGHIKFETFGKGEFELFTDQVGMQHFEFEMPKHIQYNLIENVVNSILGKEKAISTGETAARANWVLEKIIK
ncbi:Gfo/Idh/MocA family protein [Belliella marina]|uniref:Gfo/Idh/MocA family protein n=1 Tax=Belliella marina TaxID=1644146 RepID=A0ABW4VPY9_9BACT